MYRVLNRDMFGSLVEKMCCHCWADAESWKKVFKGSVVVGDK